MTEQTAKPSDSEAEQNPEALVGQFVKAGLEFKQRLDISNEYACFNTASGEVVILNNSLFIEGLKFDADLKTYQEIKSKALVPVSYIHGNQPPQRIEHYHTIAVLNDNTLLYRYYAYTESGSDVFETDPVMFTPDEELPPEIAELVEKLTSLLPIITWEDWIKD